MKTEDQIKEKLHDLGEALDEHRRYENGEDADYYLEGDDYPFTKGRVSALRWVLGERD